MTACIRWKLPQFSIQTSIPKGSITIASMAAPTDFQTCSWHLQLVTTGKPTIGLSPENGGSQLLKESKLIISIHQPYGGGFLKFPIFEEVQE